MVLGWNYAIVKFSLLYAFFFNKKEILVTKFQGIGYGIPDFTGDRRAFWLMAQIQMLEEGAY